MRACVSILTYVKGGGEKCSYEGWNSRIEQEGHFLFLSGRWHRWVIFSTVGTCKALQKCKKKKEENRLNVSVLVRTRILDTRALRHWTFDKRTLIKDLDIYYLGGFLFLHRNEEHSGRGWPRWFLGYLKYIYIHVNVCILIIIIMDSTNTQPPSILIITHIRTTMEYSRTHTCITRRLFYLRYSV